MGTIYDFSILKHPLGEDIICPAGDGPVFIWRWQRFLRLRDGIENHLLTRKPEFTLAIGEKCPCLPVVIGVEVRDNERTNTPDSLALEVIEDSRG